MAGLKTPIGGASRLGLGCSRFGSITSDLTFREAERLVHQALDLGIAVFDTADIYGQGDSERWLWRALKGRPNARIDTKAGQRFSAGMQRLRPLKPLLKPLLRRRLGRSVQAMRDRPLDLCFEPAYLRAHLHESLRRLGREQVSTFYLHNVTREALQRDEVLGEMLALRKEGLIGAVGVSTDDEAAVSFSLGSGKVDRMQASLAMLQARPDLVELATARGVEIVVREVFGGPRPLGQAAIDPEAASARLRAAAAIPGARTVLIGTHRVDRLVQAAEALGLPESQS